MEGLPDHSPFGNEPNPQPRRRGMDLVIRWNVSQERVIIQAPHAVTADWVQHKLDLKHASHAQIASEHQ